MPDTLPVARRTARTLRHAAIFTFVLLATEFVDEFIDGAHRAAWPLIRRDLGLNYEQIGMLLSLPGIIASVIEPAIMILSDVWRRRALVLFGGVLFALSLALKAWSISFWPFLLATTLFHPASGTFVNLSQISLMDAAPARREQNMARWVLAGELGIVIGTVVISAVSAAGMSWRVAFASAALMTFVLIGIGRFFSFGDGHDDRPETTFRDGIRNALRALTRFAVVRWLLLLQFSDLMLDILSGFLALYLVDVVGVSPAQAGMVVLVSTIASLVGSFLIIPVLERCDGLRYLRWSCPATLVLYVAFLLLPGLWPKILVLVLFKLSTTGWYSVLMARLYGEMPGQGGTVNAAGNVFGFVGQMIPLGLGFSAEHFGLGPTMWLLLAGPIALIVGMPRRGSAERR